MDSIALGVILVVRLYGVSGLSDVARADAISVARGILAGAGVVSEWVNCDTRPAVVPECDRPVTASELSVRLVRAVDPQNDRAAVELGYSLVDRQRGGGTLATVYTDRVTTLAARSGNQVGLVLGRAIAHEAGHLLLGTNAHSRNGLMRAVWSQQTLRRNLPMDWTFSDAEAASIRDAVAWRSIETRHAGFDVPKSEAARVATLEPSQPASASAF